MAEDVFAWFEIRDVNAVFAAFHSDDVFAPFEASACGVNCGLKVVSVPKCGFERIGRAYIGLGRVLGR